MKQESPGKGVVVTVAAVVAAGVGLYFVTNSVVPKPRLPPTIINKTIISWPYKYTNELHELGFTFQVKSNLLQKDWAFFTNVVGTNVLVVSTTNRAENRFFRQAKTYRLDMPNNPHTTLVNTNGL